MLLWGFWALTALQSPAPSPAHVVLGLAVVAAALLVVLAAAGVPVLGPMRAPELNPGTARSAEIRLPRLFDPGAAGRPRPRAPSGYPAAA